MDKLLELYLSHLLEMVADRHWEDSPATQSEVTSVLRMIGTVVRAIKGEG